MAQNVGNVTATLDLDTRKATQSFRKFEREVAKSSRNLNGLGAITQDARKFESALGAATNRVTAFAAAAVVFDTLQNSISAFVTSVIDVDKALAKINVNLGQSGEGLKKFSQDLFNIARQTGQTFDVTAKAAEELARQGLSAEETTKRLKDALILSRIAGIDSADAVESLTAAINSFNQSALTSSEIINKFAAVDTKFAVSSKDLSEAISRVGSTAQAAGVDINQLIGLVTSLQQTTALGGANIGNGLKTIFTRITASPETVKALEGLGVAIKDSNGNLRNGVQILQDYVSARERLTEAEQASTDRIVAGTFQINKLKATLADVSKEYGIYANATRTATNATDEAITKNAQLNQTLSSLLNQASVSFKQFFAAIGEGSISPALKSILDVIEKTRSILSGENGNQLGEYFGNGIIKGITSVLTGPVAIGVGAVLFNAFKKVFATLAQDAQTLFKINDATAARARVQERINYLLQVATKEEREQLMLARGNVAAQAEQLRLIQARVAAQEITGSPLTNALISRNIFGKPNARNFAPGKMPGFADPIASAIARESVVGGVPPSSVYIDRDARVASPSNPMGLLVANTRDEPLGGYQGVNRVISSGGNPKLGSIPNFAKSWLGNKTGNLKSQSDLVAERLGIAKIPSQGIAPSALDIGLQKTAGAVEEAKKLAKITNLLNKAIKNLTEERLNKLNQTLGLVDKAFTRYSQQLQGYNTYKTPIGPQRPDVVFAQNQTSPYIPPVSGTIDTATPMMERNKMRAKQSKKLPNRGLLGPMLPINPEIQARLGEIADENARERIDKVVEASQNRRRKKLAELTKKRERNMQRAQLGGVALSFASGFIPEEASGTGKGIAYGAASGAAYGAGIGGIFGPTGLVVGAAVGGLVGAFSKLKKSTEEVNEEINKNISQRNKERDSLEQALGALEDLAIARREGADAETIGRLEKAAKSAQSGLTVETAAILNESDPAKRKKMFLTDEEKRRKANVKDEITKLINENKNPTADLFRKAMGDNFKLNSEQASILGGAARTDFTIPELVTNAKTGTSNIKEVNAAQERYRKSLEVLTPVFEDFVDVAKLTPENLREFSETLLKAAAQIKTVARLSSTSAGPIRPSLNKDSFLSLPNQDVFARGGLAKRFPGRGTSMTRDMARFESLQALASESPDLKQKIESSSEYKQLRAKTQLYNLGRTAISGLGLRGNFGQANNLNLNLVRNAVNSRAASGDLEASYYKDLLDRGFNSAQDAGAFKPTTYTAYSGGKFNSSSQMSALGFKSINESMYGQGENVNQQIFNQNFNTRLAAARARDGQVNYNRINKNTPTETTTSAPTNDANVKVDVGVNGLVKIVTDAFEQAKLQTVVDQAVKTAIEQYVAPLKADLQSNGMLPPEPPKLNNFNRTY